MIPCRVAVADAHHPLTNPFVGTPGGDEAFVAMKCALPSCIVQQREDDSIDVDEQALKPHPPSHGITTSMCRVHRCEGALIPQRAVSTSLQSSSRGNIAPTTGEKGHPLPSRGTTRDTSSSSTSSSTTTTTSSSCQHHDFSQGSQSCSVSGESFTALSPAGHSDNHQHLVHTSELSACVCKGAPPPAAPCESSTLIPRCSKRSPTSHSECGSLTHNHFVPSDASRTARVEEIEMLRGMRFASSGGCDEFSLHSADSNVSSQSQRLSIAADGSAASQSRMFTSVRRATSMLALSSAMSPTFFEERMTDSDASFAHPTTDNAVVTDVSSGSGVASQERAPRASILDASAAYLPPRAYHNSSDDPSLFPTPWNHVIDQEASEVSSSPNSPLSLSATCEVGNHVTAEDVMATLTTAGITAANSSCPVPTNPHRNERHVWDLEDLPEQITSHYKIAAFPQPGELKDTMSVPCHPAQGNGYYASQLLRRQQHELILATDDFVPHLPEQGEVAAIDLITQSWVTMRVVTLSQCSSLMANELINITTALKQHLHPCLKALVDVIWDAALHRFIVVTEHVDYDSIASVESDGTCSVAVPMDGAAMVAMGVSLASALAYLHREGIAHGDVCPENVAMSRIGSFLLGGAGLPPLLRVARTRQGCRTSVAASATSLAAQQRQDVAALGWTLYSIGHGRTPDTDLPSSSTLFSPYVDAQLRDWIDVEGHPNATADDCLSTLTRQ